MDFSAPGTSSDKFAFASNYFSMAEAGACPGNSSPARTSLAMDWADWLGATASSHARRCSSYGPDQFTPRVAVQVPATSPNLRIVIELTPDGTALDVKYYTVNGSVAANTTVTSAGVDLTEAGVIAPFLTPPPPNQPGPEHDRQRRRRTSDRRHLAEQPVCPSCRPTRARRPATRPSGTVSGSAS